MPHEHSIEANLNNRSSGSETSLLSEKSDTASAAQPASLNTTCVVDESVFKIPTNYRCINYYADSASLVPQASGGAAGVPGTGSRGYPPATPYYHHIRPSAAVDEDDILLQLAIQQSLSESQGADVGGVESPEESLTAMEMLAGSRQGGIKNKLKNKNSLNLILMASKMAF